MAFYFIITLNTIKLNSFSQRHECCGLKEEGLESFLLLSSSCRIISCFFFFFGLLNELFMPRGAKAAHLSCYSVLFVHYNGCRITALQRHVIHCRDWVWFYWVVCSLCRSSAHVLAKASIKHSGFIDLMCWRMILCSQHHSYLLNIIKY